MGGCASADDNADEYEIEEDDDAKLDAAEKATAMADRLSTEVKESQGVLDARKTGLGDKVQRSHLQTEGET